MDLFFQALLLFILERILPPGGLKPRVITAQENGGGPLLENRKILLVHRLSSKEALLLQALLQCPVLISAIFSEFANLAP